jgi:hypothetical protein
MYVTYSISLRKLNPIMFPKKELPSILPHLKQGNDILLVEKKRKQELQCM